MLYTLSVTLVGTKKVQVEHHTVPSLKLARARFMKTIPLN